MDVRIQSGENHELANFRGLFNAEKTGIADGELLCLFSDPLALTFVGADHSVVEQRF